MPSTAKIGSLPVKSVHDYEVILASAARTTTTTGSAVYLPRAANAYIFVLDVTAVAGDAGDALDVQVQSLFPCAADVWIPVVSFTQVVVSGGALRHCAKVNLTDAQAMFVTSASLAAGSVRHLMGDAVRVVGTVTDADADASFTYGVYCWPV